MISEHKILNTIQTPLYIIHFFFLLSLSSLPHCFLSLSSSTIAPPSQLSSTIISPLHLLLSSHHHQLTPSFRPSTFFSVHNTTISLSSGPIRSPTPPPQLSTFRSPSFQQSTTTPPASLSISFTHLTSHRQPPTF